MANLIEPTDASEKSNGQNGMLGLASLGAMVAFAASSPLVFIAFKNNWHVAIQTIALLLWPSMLAVWIYTAIKGLHHGSLYFWSMRSTKISYVFLAVTVALLFLIPAAGLLGGEGSQGMLAGFIATLVAWVLFLGLILITNVRATGSVPLALAVSGLQLGALLFIWLWVLLMLAERDTKRAQEEYDRRPY